MNTKIDIVHRLVRLLTISIWLIPVVFLVAGSVGTQIFVSLAHLETSIPGYRTSVVLLVPLFTAVVTSVAFLLFVPYWILLLCVNHLLKKRVNKEFAHYYVSLIANIACIVIYIYYSQACSANFRCNEEGSLGSGHIYGGLFGITTILWTLPFMHACKKI